MNLIFYVVYRALDFISSLTGFSYNEINIIVYYLIIPFVYVALLDRILRRHWLKVAYVAGWATVLLCIGNFRVFCDWLFDRSVDFLLSFSAVGLDYVAASVVICVLLPGVVFVGLAYCAFKPFFHRNFPSLFRPTGKS